MTKKKQHLLSKHICNFSANTIGSTRLQRYNYKHELQN